jgi:hypothetical protein
MNRGNKIISITKHPIGESNAKVLSAALVEQKTKMIKVEAITVFRNITKTGEKLFPSRSSKRQYVSNTAIQLHNVAG